MITAVKHGQPKRVMNNSPYYITTNTLPDFDDEDENVHRRIQVYKKKKTISVILILNFMKWFLSRFNS